MTDKEFRQLRRSELVEIIYELQKSNEALTKENEELKSQLEEKRIKISKAGSIAEATVGLSDIFQSAQKTADKYVEHVKANSAEAERRSIKIMSDAEKESKRIIREANRKADKKWAEFNKKAEAVLRANAELKHFLKNKG